MGLARLNVAIAIAIAQTKSPHVRFKLLQVASSTKALLATHLPSMLTSCTATHPHTHTHTHALVPYINTKWRFLQCIAHSFGAVCAHVTTICNTKFVFGQFNMTQHASFVPPSPSPSPVHNIITFAAYKQKFGQL